MRLAYFTRVILLLVVGLVPFGAAATDTLNVRLYKHVLAAPAPANVKALVGYLKQEAHTPREQAEAIYYWITENIAYDYELAAQEQITTAEVAPEQSIARRKNVCAGYALLYAAMAKQAGLECELISGHTRTTTGSGMHTWNAVRLDGRWQLLDATWGSGGTEQGTTTFRKQLDLRYLFAEPDFLLITHFPNKAQWQLLPDPIGLGTFQGILWNHKRETLHQQEVYQATTRQTALLHRKT